MMGDVRNELVHRMSRRSVHNDYSTRGIYHIVGKVLFCKEKVSKKVLAFFDEIERRKQKNGAQMTNQGLEPSKSGS